MLNPARAYRDWRWRRRVEWFRVEAEKAREWRDNPWNMRSMRNWQPDLIRKELTGRILIDENGCVSDPDYWEWLDCLRVDHDHGIRGVGSSKETAFPATLRPGECVFDRTYRCTRDDHHHGDSDE